MSDTFFVAVEKCPLCESSRRKLTCTRCVKKGDFTLTANPNGGTFAEKGRVVLELIQRNKALFENVKLFAQRNGKLEKKKGEILIHKLKIEALRGAVDSLRNETNLQNDELSKRKFNFVKKVNDLETLKHSKHERIDEGNRYQNDCIELRQKLRHAESKLVEMRKTSVQNLKQDIFPITSRPVYKDFGTPPGETLATRGLSNDLVIETSCSPELDLEEATTCTYMEGEWVQTSLSENEYCIAGCGLPSSGDYGNYFDWMRSSRKEARGPDDEDHLHDHPALEVPAALTYTCQAVNVLSKILAVNLPFKVNYGDLANPYINQMKLFAAILKLNKNIMHLCFSQLVHPNQLLMIKTLHNLDTCLSENNQSLGHLGNFETYSYKIDSLFPELEHDALQEFDSESNDDESSTKDGWDSLKDLQELQREDWFQEERSSSSTENSFSYSATGLAASVTSLWPWKKS